eukprot:TRINITY_DN24720_c0_g1_i2.p1 TRINITY_DN24720_c0_g1~~TRINITY_DN24720_c0_g1_i2.p1  ORF type:complete len:276 (-),score=42.27 TRINITY_DN24720_c0_g1_i2:50-877(-)
MATRKPDGAAQAGDFLSDHKPPFEHTETHFDSGADDLVDRFLPTELMGKVVLLQLPCESDDEGGMRKWQVTDEAIRSGLEGVTYRNSKDKNDKSSEISEFGSVVRGTLEGDGWVRIPLKFNDTGRMTAKNNLLLRYHTHRLVEETDAMHSHPERMADEYAIEITKLSGDPWFEQWVRPESKVHELKYLIQQHRSIPHYSQQLFLADERLADDKTLIDCGVQQGTTLLLLVKCCHACKVRCSCYEATKRPQDAPSIRETTCDLLEHYARLVRLYLN